MRLHNGDYGAGRRHAKTGGATTNGREKQRRHRERVKARLAEAERLKILLAPAPGEGVRDIPAIYDHILNELGATHEEREALRAEIGAIQSELRAVLEARARNDLERIRARQRKRNVSLLPRLEDVRPRDGG